MREHILVSFLSTNGNGKIVGINPDHLPMEIKKFTEMGAKFEISTDSIEVESPKQLSPIDISTLPFPGIATDLQPIFGASLLKANGTSIITENVYDQRFSVDSRSAENGCRYTNRVATCND